MKFTPMIMQAALLISMAEAQIHFGTRHCTPGECYNLSSGPYPCSHNCNYKTCHENW